MTTVRRTAAPQCPYGALSCVVCTDLCTFQEGAAGAYCGDGEVHELEDCQSCSSTPRASPARSATASATVCKAVATANVSSARPGENCPSDCTCTSGECNSAGSSRGASVPARRRRPARRDLRPASERTLRLHLTSCDPGVGEPSPSISGQWNDFCEACEPMVDYDGSGIWNRTSPWRRGKSTVTSSGALPLREDEQSALLENLSANET